MVMSVQLLLLAQDGLGWAGKTGDTYAAGQPGAAPMQPGSRKTKLSGHPGF